MAALRWLKRARCQNALIPDVAIAEAKEVIALGDKVVAIEQQEMWSIDGLSLRQRLERYTNAANTRSSIEFDDIMRQMHTLAANGSWTAWDFVSAYSMLKNAFYSIDSGCVKDGLQSVCSAHMIWSPLDIPKEKLSLLHKVAQELLTNEPNQENALFVLGISSSKPVTFWLHCTVLYPQSAIFHAYLGKCYASMGQMEGAFRSYTQAVSLPNDNKTSTQHLVWLYERACCLRRLYTMDSSNVNYVLEAFKLYLNCAPNDHVKFPHALFTLSTLYATVGDISNASTFYNQGVKAENGRLPCLLPINTTTKQLALKMLQSLRKTPTHVKPSHLAPKRMHPTPFPSRYEAFSSFFDLLYIPRPLY